VKKLVLGDPETDTDIVAENVAQLKAYGLTLYAFCPVTSNSMRSRRWSAMPLGTAFARSSTLALVGASQQSTRRRSVKGRMTLPYSEGL
jgi:hypothetical protein